MSIPVRLLISSNDETKSGRSIRDFVSIEYNNLISCGNYKLLSIRSEKIIQNLKRVSQRYEL